MPPSSHFDSRSRAGSTPDTRPSLLIRLRDSQDAQAWAEFLEIYTPLIERLARRRGLQDADAADLAQDVFRALMLTIADWDPDPARGSFRGWLSRVARNMIVNRLVALRRQPQGSGDTGFGRWLQEQPEPSERIETESEFDEERRKRLFAWGAEQARSEFRPATWEAFWRTAVEGRAPADVARELGITVGSVYVAKSRVLARIRCKIEEDLDETESQDQG